jgi:hypothetical protein
VKPWLLQRDRGFLFHHNVGKSGETLRQPYSLKAKSFAIS